MEWHSIVITITYSFSSQRPYVNIRDTKFSEIYMATLSTNLSDVFESGEMDCSEVPEGGSIGKDFGIFCTSRGALNDYGHVDI